MNGQLRAKMALVMNNDTKHTRTHAEAEKQRDKDLNRDPITGEPGSHPAGAGVGAGGGAAAGAAVGAVGGPVGAVVGAVVGGVAGGLGGKAVAEKIDPTAEEAYWRENHRSQEFATEADDYDRDYAPAYRTGYTGATKYEGTYEDNEAHLEKDFETNKGDSNLTWADAKMSARAGFNRVAHSLSTTDTHESATTTKTY